MSEFSDGGARPQHEDHTWGGDDTLAYAAPGPRVSVLGVASMCLGVGSIVLCLAGPLGVMLALAALPMGIVARVLIDRNPQRLGGVGYANLGIATAVLAVVSFALLVPSIGHARGPSIRSVCAANLRGLMQSVVVYAADNAGAFPMISPVGGYGLAAAGSGTGQVDESATIKSIHASPPAPSVVQNMWLLVLQGAIAPKQFICKSDSFAIPATNSAAGGPICFTNFNDGKAASDLAYSYSFAYPWTAGGKVGDWWKDSMDGSLPLMADMAPLAGTGTPAATPGDGRSKNANSFTHDREGQNVAFADAHAEYTRLPNAGHKNDDIYAGSKGVPAAIGVQTAGVVPDIGTGGGPAAWDVCLVPAADGRTGVRK